MLADPTQRPPLPLATKRDRQVHVPTSYTEGTTPEQALAVAVILQAISDLQSKDEQERFEAHEFFLQPKGPWADMRRFYFQAVRLDDDWLHAHLGLSTASCKTLPHRAGRTFPHVPAYSFCRAGSRASHTFWEAGSVMGPAFHLWRCICRTTTTTP